MNGQGEGLTQTTTKPPEVTVTNEKGNQDDQKLSTTDEEETDEDSIFAPFTPQSFENILIREAEDKRKAEEKKNAPQEGRLVDGELKFGDDDEEGDGEPKWDRDPALVEGCVLPESLGKPPKHLLLEEIDPVLKEKVRFNSIHFQFLNRSFIAVQVSIVFESVQFNFRIN